MHISARQAVLSVLVLQHDKGPAGSRQGMSRAPELASTQNRVHHKHDTSFELALPIQVQNMSEVSDNNLRHRTAVGMNAALVGTS